MAELKERYERFGSFETIQLNEFYTDEGLYDENKVMVIYRFRYETGASVAIAETEEKGIVQLCTELQYQLNDKLWQEVQKKGKKEKN